VTDEVERRLTGGNIAEVVRVGDTVRKPAGAGTPAVHALLEHLHAVGFRAAPRSRGLDDAGRHVLDYVEGDVVHPRLLPDDELPGIGRLTRELHDAVADFRAPDGTSWDVRLPHSTVDTVAHHDLAPWNLVRAAEGFVLIDWDGAGPGSRAEELAYSARAFAPLAPGTDVDRAGARLRLLADGYGLDEAGRTGLGSVLGRPVQAMADLLRRGHETGEQPWARLWDEGHGRMWQADAGWIERHGEQLRRALG
jgi:Phosphotransferase enzyme family